MLNTKYENKECKKNFKEYNVLNTKYENKNCEVKSRKRKRNLDLEKNNEEVKREKGIKRKCK